MFRIIRTSGDGSLFVARVAAGAVLLPHGLQKLLGLFGGSGWGGTTSFFTDQLDQPYAIAVGVILAESLGALGLIVGFMGRLCALGNLIVMGGAVYMVHWDHGFFMNWHGTQAGEGFEYHVLMSALLLTVMIGGSGPLSVDSHLALRRGT